MKTPRKRAFGRSPLQSLIHSIGEQATVNLIRLCGISAVIFVFGIFFFIFRESIPFISHRLDLQEFFLSSEWYPTSRTNPRFGIFALICGSVAVTVVAQLVSVPFGLSAAIFIGEFCRGALKEFLKIAIEFLAAIPSIVWGFLGLMVLNPLIIKLTGAPVGLNVLNGGIVVGLMAVPIVVSIAEDALRAVPDTYREAAEALGATKWQEVFRVVIPAAKNGLLAAVLLGVGRAIGETMAVLMCTGHAINVPFDKNFPFIHLLMPVQTLTATIASELGEAPRIGPGPNGTYPPEAFHYYALFTLGVVLFTITFFINLAADLIVKGVKRR